MHPAENRDLSWFTAIQAAPQSNASISTSSIKAQSAGVENPQEVMKNYAAVVKVRICDMLARQ